MATLPHSFLNRPLAHRALHDGNDQMAENNLSAIEAAIAQNYGIEIDIQISRCGTAMVFHDYSLSRLTNGTGVISQYDKDQLQKLRFTTGEIGIPTLEDVVRLVDGRVPLLIEVKDQDGQMGKNIGPLEASIAASLKDYHGDAALMSFNPHTVIELSRLCPDRPLGITSCDFTDPMWHYLNSKTRENLKHVPHYDEAKASFISYDRNALDTPPVHTLKEKGAAIVCWTVKSKEQEIQARKVADNITFEGYEA